MMREFLRDYGAAIGPTLAFVVAVAMLWVKDAFERRAARRKAERRIRKIAELLRDSPPPTFRSPASASDCMNAMLENAVAFSRFYDRMAAVEGALKSAEVPIHEDAPVELIMRYHRLKQALDDMLHEREFVRKPNAASSPVPDQDNFFNVTQAWRSMVAAADGTSIENVTAPGTDERPQADGSQ